MKKLRKIISNVLDIVLAFVLLCIAASEGEEESHTKGQMTKPLKTP